MQKLKISSSSYCHIYKSIENHLRIPSLQWPFLQLDIRKRSEKPRSCLRIIYNARWSSPGQWLCLLHTRTTYPKTAPRLWGTTFIIGKLADQVMSIASGLETCISRSFSVFYFPLQALGTSREKTWCKRSCNSPHTPSVSWTDISGTALRMPFRGEF